MIKETPQCGIADTAISENLREVIATNEDQIIPFTPGSDALDSKKTVKELWKKVLPENAAISENLTEESTDFNLLPLGSNPIPHTHWHSPCTACRGNSELNLNQEQTKIESSSNDVSTQEQTTITLATIVGVTKPLTEPSTSSNKSCSRPSSFNDMSFDEVIKMVKVLSKTLNNLIPEPEEKHAPDVLLDGYTKIDADFFLPCLGNNPIPRTHCHSPGTAFGCGGSSGLATNTPCSPQLGTQEQTKITLPIVGVTKPLTRSVSMTEPSPSSNKSNSWPSSFNDLSADEPSWYLEMEKQAIAMKEIMSKQIPFVPEEKHASDEELEGCTKIATLKDGSETECDEAVSVLKEGRELLIKIQCPCGKRRKISYSGLPLF